MKKLTAFMLGLILLAGVGTIWARGEEKETKEVALAGEVVDVNCYLIHGGEGKEHASCAKQCFQKGLPVALLSKGQLYLAIGMKHTPANKLLAPFAGKNVVVKGRVFKGEGLMMVEVRDVQEAK